MKFLNLKTRIGCKLPKDHPQVLNFKEKGSKTEAFTMCSGAGS